MPDTRFNLSADDSSLLGSRLKLNDFSTLKRIGETQTESLEGAEIVAEYDVTPPAQQREGSPRLACVNCHKQRHWKGFIVQLHNGQLALIGNDCGRDRFGIDWGNLRNAHDANKKRQTLLRDMLDLSARLPALRQAFRATPAEWAEQFDSLRKTLTAIEKRGGFTWPNDGMLQADIRRTDPGGAAAWDAMTTTAKKRLRDEQSERTTKVSREVIGALQGAKLLERMPAMKTRFTQSQRQLDNIAAAIPSNSAQATTQELESLWRRFRDLRETVDEMRGQYASAERFFTTENAALFQRLSQTHDRFAGILTMTQSELRWTDGTQTVRAIRPTISAQGVFTKLENALRAVGGLQATPEATNPKKTA